MKSFLSFLLSLLYPKRCGFCNKIIAESKHYLCNNCLSEIKFIENSCKKCGKPLLVGYDEICSNCRSIRHYFDRAYSAAQYKGALKKAIIKYKFYKKKEIVNAFIEIIMPKLEEIGNIDLVMGVPLHSEKLKERGFNQSEVLARLIAQKKGWDFDNTSLVRVRKTKSQAGLPKRKRLKNLKGAFKVIDNAKIKYKSILLIDDIYTTGATVSECAKILKKSGADKVYVLTIASGEGY